MRREPTLIEKIEALTDPLELEGFAGKVFEDGRMTSEIQQAIARRRVELQLRNPRA